ncbi:MAG: hypothetical protein LBI88_03325, partial [Deltaproteobacteria bacterium]|nr:hypothetical protein [Deltaproteobacteria bacterium]
EHRKSATYYALTALGIPAFCIETSHDLPNLEAKVYQHNLVVNAFLNLFGVEFEQPGLTLGTPILSYLIVSVNKKLPLAIPNGQTLLVAPGADVEIVDVRANYERGIVIAVHGLDAFNPLRTPFTFNQKTTVTVRKDMFFMGHITIAPLPQGESFPRIVGDSRIVPLYEPISVSLPSGVPPKTLMAGASPTPESGRQTAKMPDSPPKAASNAVHAPAAITGFLLEVDGHVVEVKPKTTLSIAAGSMIKLIDFVTDGVSLPESVVMNLVGFVPKDIQRNTGDDRGFVVNTAKDLQTAYSVKGKSGVYAVQAEQGREVLTSCFLQFVQPKLASVTLRFKGNTKTVGAGKRIDIPAGATVEILEVSLAEGVTASNLRLTLGGHAVARALPQACIMRDIALNLAVFNGDVLAGKVTWAP